VSGWEFFTWFNVGVLSLGSVIVFLLFLRQRRDLLPPPPGAEGGDGEADAGDRTGPLGERGSDL